MTRISMQIAQPSYLSIPIQDTFVISYFTRWFYLNWNVYKSYNTSLTVSMLVRKKSMEKPFLLWLNTREFLLKFQTVDAGFIRRKKGKRKTADDMPFMICIGRTSRIFLSLNFVKMFCICITQFNYHNVHYVMRCNSLHNPYKTKCSAIFTCSLRWCRNLAITK